MKPGSRNGDHPDTPHWAPRLETLLLLSLAFHGVMLLRFDGRPGEWIVVALVALLAVWALIRPSQGGRATSLRAAGALAASWILSSTTGGTASLFTLWLFPIAGLYPFLLRRSFAMAMPITALLLYFSLGFLPESWLPWSITLSQGVLIALLSGGTLAIRLSWDEMDRRRAGALTQRFRANQLAAMARLAQGVAHDFNNFLTVISGEIGLAQTKLETQSSANVTLENAAEATAQAIALSRRLQICAGHLSLEIRAISLNRLIETVVSEWESERPSNIRSRLELAEDLPQMHGDPQALTMLLREMIIHAETAIGAGEGMLTFQTRRQTLSTTDAGYDRYTSRTPGPGSYIALTIENNGATLDDDSLEHLFEPYQATYARTHGLGLALVLGILRAHQGYARVESCPGANNVFSFLFPLTPQEANSPVARTIEPSPAERSSLRLILLISEDISLRESLEHQLSDEPYRVMIATTGERGLALYDEFSAGIVLVVLDLGASNEREPELMAELQSRDTDLPIIVIGQDYPAAQETTLQIAYLARPFRPAELASKVRQMLPAEETGSDSSSAPATGA